MQFYFDASASDYLPDYPLDFMSGLIPLIDGFADVSAMNVVKSAPRKMIFETTLETGLDIRYEINGRDLEYTDGTLTGGDIRYISILFDGDYGWDSLGGMSYIDFDGADLHFAQADYALGNDIAIRDLFLGNGISYSSDTSSNSPNEVISFKGMGNARDWLLAGDDSFQLGYGNDRVDTGLGNDWVMGSDGRDVIKGNRGNDQLMGDNGNDKILGGNGFDIVDGNNGQDKLFGGRGSDALYGGNGHDRLDGGKGNDYLHGDNGNDTFVFKGAHGRDHIADFDASLGGDRIRIDTGLEMDIDTFLATRVTVEDRVITIKTGQNSSIELFDVDIQDLNYTNVLLG